VVSTDVVRGYQVARRAQRFVAPMALFNESSGTVRTDLSTLEQVLMSKLSRTQALFVYPGDFLGLTGVLPCAIGRAGNRGLTNCKSSSRCGFLKAQQRHAATTATVTSCTKARAAICSSGNGGLSVTVSPDFTVAS
jgi:hypothetical protein